MLTKITLEVARSKNVLVHLRPSSKLWVRILQHFQMYTLELQRMFEHSNIIRLRFSRTNFFYERTFVGARWSIFGSHIAERSFGLARGSPGCMALLLKSCAATCHVPESSSEISKEAVTMVTWTFNLKRSMKDNPSKVSNTFCGGNLKQFGSFLRQAWCVLASSKQRQVTLVEVSCSVLFGWSQVR